TDDLWCAGRPGDLVGDVLGVGWMRVASQGGVVKFQTCASDRRVVRFDADGVQTLVVASTGQSQKPGHDNNDDKSCGYALHAKLLNLARGRRRNLAQENRKRKATLPLLLCDCTDFARGGVVGRLVIIQALPRRVRSAFHL